MKNTAAAAGADVLGRLLGFAATAYLARVLGTDAFGLMSVGLSVLGYLALVASPGLHVMGTRHIASREGDEGAWSADLTTLRVVMAVAAASAAGLVCLMVPAPPAHRLLVFLFALTVIPMGLSLEWYFQGKGQIVIVAAARVMVSLLYLAFLLLLVRRVDDLHWTAVAFAGANAVTALLLLGLFRARTAVPALQWRPSLWIPLLRQSIPLGASTALAQSVVNLPIIVAGLLLSSHETGLFSASMKLIFFALMIDRVFYTLYFPVVARYQTLGSERFVAVIRLGLRSLLWITVPVTVGGFWLAPLLINLVYGTGYAGAAGTLQWVFPFFLCTTTNTVLMSVLYADRQEAGVLYDLSVGTAFLAVVTVLLTLRYGSEGTAAGLSLGEAATTLLLSVRAEKRFGVGLVRTASPVLGAGAVMMAAAWLMRSLPLPLAVPAGCVLFFAALILFRGMTREDVRFLREKFV